MKDVHEADDNIVSRRVSIIRDQQIDNKLGPMKKNLLPREHARRIVSFDVGNLEFFDGLPAARKKLVDE